MKIALKLPSYDRARLSRVYELFAKLASEFPSDSRDYRGMFRAMDSARSLINKRDWSWKFWNWDLIDLREFVVAAQDQTAYLNALMQSIRILQTHANPADGMPLTDRHALDVDGKPLRIKHDAKGWVIYSIGHDGVDDGGVEMNGMKGDFVVRLGRG
ncbi:MAG: hypothetical protein JST51_05155 [Armatimonadetes bacterium]|nr:hypothetical protein [Armatimonadota bacterium]